MRSKRHIVFLINLMQDVNIVRPLAYLAARDLDVTIVFLVTGKFLERDTLRIWQREVAEIASDLAASVHIYESALDAVAVLQGKQGIIIAASESTLSAHRETHDVLRAAPSGFLKITLQHGYECVGFLQNREHIIAHGRNIKFAADVICGWCDGASLTSLAASERSKLYVSGPTLVLNAVKPGSNAPVSGGLVCENLHSVRMRATGDFGKSFMDNFGHFCDRLAEFGQTVNLRPHPGGMYVVKNNVTLPGNVVLNTKPMYKVDLSAYAFGVSAPSTVALDMVFAGIPVAVWRDAEGIMDASNYDGLTPISTAADWFAFARDAVLRRDHILEQQQRFVDRLSMPVDSKDVYRRFASLLANGTTSIGGIQTSGQPDPAMPRRITFIANGPLPTLQLSFLKPLAPHFESRRIDHEIVTEIEISDAVALLPAALRSTAAKRSQQFASLVRQKLEKFEPDIIVACRYSGPAAAEVLNWANSRDVPVVYHVDDDLLNIPPEIGHVKYTAHNHPNRLGSVDCFLRGCELVYCSTRELKLRFRQLGYRTSMLAGQIYCSGNIINRADPRPVKRIGYMGFDHAHDFQIVLPSLVRYLRRNPEIEFELFGSIPRPDSLDEFGSRVTVLEPVRNYEEFLRVFAGRNWDIGLCPLARTPFNIVKANTKWVEYTSVGAAVLATAGMVYDGCCSGGCGMLLRDDEWLEAMEHLTDNPDIRYAMVEQAQRRVEADYNVPILRAQVMSVFDQAMRMKAKGGSEQWPHAPRGTLAALASPAETRLL